MWTRDASHVASAALGAYAFSEIAARVVGDAVAPDTARWLTLVALAVVASAFALVARADARRARADSAEAERRARRDARFRAAVLERATRRDPSRDPEDATRVDCLAALARVVDAGFSLGDGGARAGPLARLASAAGDAREARGGARVRREGERGAENPEG